MNMRKHMFLIVSGGICLVLLIAAIVLLLKGQAGYLEFDQQLQTAQTRLDALQRRVPFPSKENVRLVKQNHEDLSRFLNSWITDLRNEQVEPEKVEAAVFKRVMEKTINDLHEEAGDTVLLPDRFAFGFDTYFLGGAFPKDQDIARLTVQLKTIRRLFGLLKEARIAELHSVERDRFDEAQMLLDDERALFMGEPDSRKAPSPTATPGQGLYEKERYRLKFVSTEEALWNFLSSLARSPLFAVVSDVTLLNETHAAGFNVQGVAPGRKTATRGRGRPGMSPLVYRGLEGGLAAESSLGFRSGADEEEEGPQLNLPEAHDERIVAGREVVTAEVTLDVFRFMAAGEGESVP
jgi:hypothetical protein